MNPIQMIQNFMKNGGNPQQLIQKAMGMANNNNLIISNLINLAQNGNKNKVEQIARNMCNEMNINFDDAFPKFMNNFNKR